MAKGKYEYWITQEGLTLLKGWAREGLTNEQIAKNCSINTDTLYTWKKKYPEISEAIKKGKEVVDYEVENALLKRALGYEFQETKTKTTINGIETTIITKHIPPDTGAAAFWLKNRRPDKWRDRPEPEGDAALLKKAKELLEDIDSVVDKETERIPDEL